MVSLRALAPSLTRITTAAAVGAALHIGQGDPNLIDAKAVEFSRAVLAQTDVDGEVISCEGPKDNAPAFMKREKLEQGEAGEACKSVSLLTELAEAGRLNDYFNEGLQTLEHSRHPSLHNNFLDIRGSPALPYVFV